jgi:hypothetical protein
MKREIKEDGTRTIELGPYDCAIVYNHEGIDFDGMSPQEINSSQEQFEAAVDRNQHLLLWFDSVEMIQSYLAKYDGRPWDARPLDGDAP